MKIRVFIALLVITFTSYSESSFAEVTFDRKTQVQIDIQESEWYNYPSHLTQRIVYNVETDDHDEVDCPLWGEDGCGKFPEGSNVWFSGTVVFPMCDVVGADYCIENLEISNDNQEWQTTRFDRSIAGPIHVQVPQIGYPTAGTLSLFKPTSQDKKNGIDGYAVYASVEVRLFPKQDSEVRFSNLDLRVTPYRDLTGNYTDQKINKYTSSSGRKTLGYSSFGKGIAWAENGKAGTSLQFSQTTKVRLTTHIPSTVSGWLGGRLSHAEFALTPLSKRVNRLLIGGNPVQVGRASAIFERNNTPEFFKQQLERSPNSSVFGWHGSNGVFEVLDAIRYQMLDRSTSEEVTWSVGSFTNSTQNCLNDSTKISGLVTTNATVFNGKPPVFADGVLNYQVGGLHYQSDGLLTSGQYDLVMRSDVARCLYKYSSAPIQGSISITYESGSSEVATQVVNESNGWLHLGAYNFTYSSPVISVKLFQNSPEVTPSSQPTSKPTVKNMIVTCIKGKLIKKITAINPKCPKGYKKK